MTLQELIDCLAAVKDANPGAVVILAQDAEGNGFRPLDTISEDRWSPRNRDLVDKGGRRCVVIWPQH